MGVDQADTRGVVVVCAPCKEANLKSHNKHDGLTWPMPSFMVDQVGKKYTAKK